MLILTAERIKSLRESRDLTQSALAKKLSVTRASVNAWEMGVSVPTVDKIVDLALFFHVTTDYILGKESSIQVDITEFDDEEKKLVQRLIGYIQSKH